MRSLRRTTTWNLVFHYVSIALALVSGIALVPLYLKHIPPQLYGAWLATGNVVAWLTVLDPGLSAVLQQRVGVAYGKGDHRELNSLLTGGLILSGTIAILVLFVGVGSSNLLISWLKLEDLQGIAEIERAFLLSVYGSALLIVSYGLTAVNQGMQSSIGIGFIYLATMVASLVLTVVLLNQGVGLLALPIGQVARGIGLIIGNAGYLLWRYFLEGMDYHFSIKGVSGLASLTSYTFLGRGAAVMATNLDAFVLTRYIGAEAAPLLVLTKKAPDMSRLFLERPAMAFMPAISSLVGAGEILKAKDILVRLVRLILWTMGLVGGGFALFNEEFISLWVGSQYFAGNSINLLIVGAAVLTVVSNSISNLCFSLGGIKEIGVFTLLQGVIAVPLMIFSAKKWGMEGVAFSLFIIPLLSAWYYPILFVRKLGLRKADGFGILREVFAVIIAGSATSLIMLMVAPSSWGGFTLSVALFCAVYAMLLSGISRKCRAEISGVLQRLWIIAVH